MKEAVIVSGARTPVGKFGGAFKDISAPDLGATAIKAALERAGISPDMVDEVVLGNAIQSAEAGYAARLASLKSGIPYEVPTIAVNRQCSSGLEAINMAAQLIRTGEAEIAVANTYYIALMLSGKKGPEQQAAAKKVKPFFPNQDGRGTHMNISGGGVLKHAPNKANAIKLLEFLLTKEAQQHIVNNTFEYPMIDGVEPNKLIAQFGLGFKQDLKTKVSKYGKNQAAALKIMTEAGWE